MRKVTQQIADAFKAGKSKTVGNTSTDGQTVTLHGNVIAKRTPYGAVMVTLAGWGTVTTRDRVNGIIAAFDLPYSIGQRKGVQILYTRSPLPAEDAAMAAQNGWTWTEREISTTDWLKIN